MFSPHLFNHKYDIDDLLAALCHTSPQWLNTQTGAVTAEKSAAPASHVFAIEPLPASFLTEIARSADMTDTPSHLTEAEKAAITTILATTTIAALPAHFPHGRIGGWLRERVKDAALEWLDGNDLIPPSMRHINRAKAAKLYNSRTITIEDTE